MKECIGYQFPNTPDWEKGAAQLLEKVFKQGHRVSFVTGQEERLLFWDQFLWTFSQKSFLPHGCSARDPVPADHPIWITTLLENQNQASCVLLCDGTNVNLPFLDFNLILWVGTENDTSFWTKAFQFCASHSWEKSVLWRKNSGGWVSGPFLS
ncbi:MAG: hypothetical protein BGO07_01480 [Alphaproteobacteria bacterium 40-19]|nr:MAG: hypothetical protein BGO07_01480 [Alphaproteobacteria bacterium 40-19]